MIDGRRDGYNSKQKVNVCMCVCVCIVLNNKKRPSKRIHSSVDKLRLYVVLMASLEHTKDQ